jgi:hypothetical protein
VLSIATVPPIRASAATASWIFHQMPRRDQRLNRLSIVIDGPYSLGQFRQAQPV